MQIHSSDKICPNGKAPKYIQLQEFIYTGWVFQCASTGHLCHSPPSNAINAWSIQVHSPGIRTLICHAPCHRSRVKAVSIAPSTSIWHRFILIFIIIYCLIIGVCQIFHCMQIRIFLWLTKEAPGFCMLPRYCCSLCVQSSHASLQNPRGQSALCAGRRLQTCRYQCCTNCSRYWAKKASLNWAKHAPLCERWWQRRCLTLASRCTLIK